MLLIWISSIFTGCCSRCFRQRLRKNLSIIALVFLILLMSCNNSAYDEINMAQVYGNGHIGMTSWLYYVCSEIAFRVGFSFGWFNLITSGFACCLIAKSLSKFTSMWGVSIGLFAFCGALSDTTLCKHFLASSLLIYAISFMLEEKKNKKKFFLFFLLACSFHLSMSVYLIVLLSDLKKWNRRSKVTIYLLVGISIGALCVGTILSGGSIPGIRIVFDFVEAISEKNVTGYILNNAVSLGWLNMLALWVLSFLSLETMKNMAIRKVVNLNNNALSAILSSCKIVKLSLVFLPFSMMGTAVFSRLYKPMVWLVLLCFAIFIENLKRHTIVPKVEILVIVYCVAYFFIYNIIILHWDYSSGEVLKGTLFFIENSL